MLCARQKINPQIDGGFLIPLWGKTGVCEYIFSNSSGLDAWIMYLLVYRFPCVMLCFCGFFLALEISPRNMLAYMRYAFCLSERSSYTPFSLLTSLPKQSHFLRQLVLSYILYVLAHVRILRDVGCISFGMSVPEALSIPPLSPTLQHPLSLLPPAHRPSSSCPSPFSAASCPIAARCVDAVERALAQAAVKDASGLLSVLSA